MPRARPVCIDMFMMTLLWMSVAAVHAAPATPGKPRAEVVGTHDQHVDLRVSWTEPKGIAPVRYRYRAGSQLGGTWSSTGAAEDTFVVLRRLPLNGEYWFCVQAVNKDGQAGEDRCNRFTTPGAAAAVARTVSVVGPPPVKECEQPRREWIWCDDFEVDRINSYFEASMRRASATGIDGSVGAVARYSPGTSGAGDLKLAFGRTPDAYMRAVDEGTHNYREIYWRIYLRTPADWQGGTGYKLSRATVLAGRRWQQAMIAHVWGTGDSGARLVIDPASGTAPGGKLRTTRYNDFERLRWLGAKRSPIPLFEQPNTGKWHCIEARVRLNDPGKSNGVFQLWENGELSASHDDLNWLGSYDRYGINAVFLESYWNGGAPVTQERYLDNFVVATTRIGCR